jgi:hypothetical protein
LDDELLQLETANLDDKSAEVIFLKEANDGTIVQICNKIMNLEKGVHSPTRYVYDRDSADIIPQSVSSGKKKDTKANEK